MVHLYELFSPLETSHFVLFVFFMAAWNEFILAATFE